MGWYQRRVHGEAHPTSTTTQPKVNNFTQHNSQHVSLLLLQLQLLRLLRLLLLPFLRPLNAPLEACSDCDVIQQHLRQIGSVSTLEHTAAAKAKDNCAERKDDGCWRSTGSGGFILAGHGARIPESIAINQTTSMFLPRQKKTPPCFLKKKKKKKKKKS